MTPPRQNPQALRPPRQADGALVGWEERLPDFRRSRLHALCNLAMAAQKRLTEERREREAVVKGEAMSEWISVTERMLKEMERCLVLHSDGRIIRQAGLLKIIMLTRFLR